MKAISYKLKSFNGLIYNIKKKTLRPVIIQNVIQLRKDQIKSKIKKSDKTTKENLKNREPQISKKNV